MATFDKMMERLVEEPAFERLMESFTNFSCFQFGSLKEEHTTSLIAWLLNPRETHGSHIFLTMFLDAVSEALESGENQLENSNRLLQWVEKYRDDEDFQWEMIFEAEVNAGGMRSCDVVGVSLERDFAVIIENKLTAPISKDQLDAYDDYAESLGVKNVVRILLDADMERSSLDLKAYTKHKTHWLPLNYSWLGNSINEYLRRGRAPLEVSVLLKSFLTALEDYIEDDINQRNIFWSDTWTDVSDLGKKYYSLWKNPSYKKYRSMTAFQAVGENKNIPEYARYVYYHREMFEEFEQFEFIHRLENNPNLKFKYESELGRVNNFFHVGRLPELKDFWATCLCLKSISRPSEQSDSPPEEYYEFSLSFARSWKESEIHGKIRAFFKKNESSILGNETRFPKSAEAEVEKAFLEIMVRFERMINTFCVEHQL